MSRSVLITGGTGLIGSRLAQWLIGRGDRVVLFDSRPARWRVEPLIESSGERVCIAEGDICLLEQIRDAITTNAVTSIVHLAAVLGAESSADPQVATRVNVLGTANVLEAARVTGVERVLLASSVAVYGDDTRYPDDEIPLSEDAVRFVAEGLPIYGASKLYGEFLAEYFANSYGLVVAGLRLSTVYGAGRQRGSAVFVSELVERAVRGDPVTVDLGDASVSVIYVDDVVAQFGVLLEAKPECFKTRRFFNTGGDTCTVREFAECVGRLLPHAHITVRSSPEKSLAGMAATVSDRLLRETFGVARRFTPLEVGLQAFVGEMREMLRAGANESS